MKRLIKSPKSYLQQNMSITLYWTLISQPSRAVKCLLDIGKIEHKLQEIDLMGNQTRSKEYLAINPLGQIPFLIDGDFKLAESSAILIYLCEKFSQINSFYGDTSQQRALVNQFLSLYQSIYRPALDKIIFLKIYKGLKRKRAIKRKEILRAEAQMMEAMQVLQAMLKQNKHIFFTGSKPTIADLLYFFQITNFMLYQIKFDHLKEVSSWFHKVLQIEEVKLLTEKWKKITPMMIEMLKNIPIQQESKL